MRILHHKQCSYIREIKNSKKNSSNFYNIFRTIIDELSIQTQRYHKFPIAEHLQTALHETERFYWS